MLCYGLASGTWAGIAAEEAAARGVTLVQPDRYPSALRGYTERAWPRAPTPVIGQRFPLERAADAHAAIEVPGDASERHFSRSRPTPDPLRVPGVEFKNLTHRQVVDPTPPGSRSVRPRRALLRGAGSRGMGLSWL